MGCGPVRHLPNSYRIQKLRAHAMKNKRPIMYDTCLYGIPKLQTLQVSSLP